MNLPLSEFCKNLGLSLILTTKAELTQRLHKIEGIEYILLATGNIIEEEITRN